MNVNGVQTFGDTDIVKGPSVGGSWIVVVLLELDLEVGRVADASGRDSRIQVERPAREVTGQASQPIPTHAVGADGDAVTIGVTIEHGGQRVVFVRTMFCWPAKSRCRIASFSV